MTSDAGGETASTETPGTVLVSSHWRSRGTELGGAARSVAGAATRTGPVSVLVPGTPGPPEADGAFDLEFLGQEGPLRWPGTVPGRGAIVVDEVTPEVAGLLAEVDAGTISVFYLSAGAGSLDPRWRRLHLVGRDEPVAPLYVPVNPLAERDRHHGFGFTGYQLVLSDRTGGGGSSQPVPAVAWLSAAFPEADVVVVEDAVASAWKGRALRGHASVDTRMDLWRLLAHAQVCIDLGPGPIVARECIEALRFGTPVVVPRDSGAAVTHALEGAGAAFGDAQELIDAVGGLYEPGRRELAATAARRYGDDRHGDPRALVRGVRALLQRSWG